LYGLHLSRNLPRKLRKAASISARLCRIVRDKEVAPVRESGRLNYEITDNGIQLAADLEVDGLLAVRVCDIRIAYAHWSSKYAGKLYTLEPDESLDAIPGPLDDSNPLKAGLHYARLNARNVPVDFVAVEDPTNVNSWLSALRVLAPTDIYGLVPLTDDPEIISACRAFVSRRSRPEAARECVLWTATDIRKTVPIIRHGADGEMIAVTPISRDTHINAVETVGGNAEFVAAGVCRGDVLRYNYHFPAADADCYEETVIEEVVNEDTLKIQPIAGDKIPATSRVEIWRNQTTADTAAAAIDTASTYNDSRIRLLASGTFRDGNREIAPRFVCAALAGLRSALAPHQSLAGVPLEGLTGVEYRNVSALDFDKMEELGVWLLEVVDGKVVTRRGTTTAGDGNPVNSDEAVVTNIDVVKKMVRSSVRAVVKHAATADTQLRVKIAANTALRRLANGCACAAGPQIVSGELSTLRRHVMLASHLTLNICLALPVKNAGAAHDAVVEIDQQVVV
jgi:hypothetical protein